MTDDGGTPDGGAAPDEDTEPDEASSASDTPSPGDTEDIDDNIVPIDGTREITGFVTYLGEGFATVRRAPEQGADADPKPASSRRYLRDGLPAVYREQDFTMRFVEALEGVLDPIVAVLDGLGAHFDPDLAPPDMLDLTTGWLGLKHNQAQPTPQLRTLVHRGVELARLRGTHAGLELALQLNFPQLPLRVEDGGEVRISTGGELPEAKAPSFVVYCDSAIPKDEAASVVRVIDAVKPAHVSYRLRTKRPKEKAEKRG